MRITPIYKLYMYTHTFIHIHIYSSNALIHTYAAGGQCQRGHSHAPAGVREEECRAQVAVLSAGGRAQELPGVYEGDGT